jgi:type IV secretory pathway VirJ component
MLKDARHSKPLTEENPAMTKDEFLALSEHVGHILQRHPCPNDEQWTACKAEIRAALDEAGMTAADFDARLRQVATAAGQGRRRLVKLTKLNLGDTTMNDEKKPETPETPTPEPTSTAPAKKKPAAKKAVAKKVAEKKPAPEKKAVAKKTVEKKTAPDNRAALAETVARLHENLSVRASKTAVAVVVRDRRAALITFYGPSKCWSPWFTADDGAVKGGLGHMNLTVRTESQLVAVARKVLKRAGIV